MIVMVIGIAVSNGILLVDDANRRFLAGAEKLEAIVLAACCGSVIAGATVVPSSPESFRAALTARAASAAELLPK